jgi:hypothetical protein
MAEKKASPQKAAPQRRSASKPRGDVTGRQAEEATAKAIEDEQLKAEALTMVTAQHEKEIDEGVVDYTSGGVDPDADRAEVAQPKQRPVDAPVTVRVNETLMNCRIGHNFYNFEAGRQYNVPGFVADHLEEKGLLW